MNLIQPEDLYKIIPHRPPFIWVDEVIEANLLGGLCRVLKKEDALYLENGRIRQSSFIEWMAQSYAFTRAALVVIQVLDGKSMGRAFLVSIQDASFPNEPEETNKVFFIHIDQVRAMGPIILFKGKVTAGKDGPVVAQARLKIFAD